jgi:hypothetical protein
MTHDEILERLGIDGDTGKASCPAHEDDVASLSVTRSDEDKILVRCHAGCEQQDVLRALQLTHGISARDLGNGVPPVPREVARYVYRDGGGSPVFTKIRFHPKDFVIDPSGADTKSHLYRLPEILAAPAVKTVLWVEGEKAADRLTSEGLLATTLGGATKSPDKAVKILKGRRVVILPDNDEAGRKHAETVSRCLRAAGVHTIRTLLLPGTPVKGDVVDWLDSGHTIDELSTRVRQSLGTVTASSMAVVSPEWVWRPRVPAKGLTLIFGEAGIGKSTMVLDLAARWTRGDPMPESVGTTFKPITVGIYGCEDDLSSIVIPRLMAAGANLDRIVFLELDKAKPILPDQIGRMKQLCDEAEVKVLIIDNVENGMGNLDSNNSKSLRHALSPLSDFGIPVIAIHHPKKGSVRGSATEAMSGSQAYTNVARSTMMVIKTGEENLVAFAPVKSNYVNINETRTLYFKIGTREVDGIDSDQPHVEWKGGDYASADTLMARALAKIMDEQAREMNAIRAAAAATTSPSVSTPIPLPSGSRNSLGGLYTEKEVCQDFGESISQSVDIAVLTSPAPSHALPPEVTPCVFGQDDFVTSQQKKYGYGPYKRVESDEEERHEDN